MFGLATGKTGSGPDIGKGIAAIPGLGPAIPRGFKKIEIIRIMDRADRVHAVILGIKQLCLDRVGNGITNDRNTPGVFKTRHHAPVMHFAGPVMGIVTRIEENPHGTALLTENLSWALS